MSLEKPIMLYDGDCGFCKRWIRRWKRVTRGHVQYAPYQAVVDEFPQFTEAEYEEAVQYVSEDGSVVSGAEAVLKSFADSDHPLFYQIYQKSSVFASATEAVYQWVAENRESLSI